MGHGQIQLMHPMHGRKLEDMYDVLQSVDLVLLENMKDRAQLWVVQQRMLKITIADLIQDGRL